MHFVEINPDIPVTHKIYKSIFKAIMKNKGLSTTSLSISNDSTSNGNKRLSTTSLKSNE